MNWNRTLRALIFDNGLRYVTDHPRPEAKPGWARVEVQLAGICGTDLEITRGYRGFRGVLGHEFLGIVEDCNDASLAGRRVVGEINAACGLCGWCARGLGRHCPERSTMGILNHDGCMADYCVLPLGNLRVVGPDIADERAILAEPLSAACEILEQLSLDGNERAVVLGDGRLGILCAWALATVTPDVVLVGHHPEKLAAARWRTVRTTMDIGAVTPGADIVVDATGSGRGIAEAMSICRPRGVIVLKSTAAGRETISLAPVVVNELTVIGSRCGRFDDGLAMMRAFPDMPLEQLITDRFPLDRALEAFDRAGSGKALKVVLQVNV